MHRSPLQDSQYVMLLDSSKYLRDSVETGRLQSPCVRETGKRRMQLTSEAKKQISDNRRKIIRMIKTAIVCGLQPTGYTFTSSQGHRDDGSLTLATAKFNNNNGNFRALLRYRGNNDCVFRTHIFSCERISQYTSPRIQNEIINACNDLIL